jgi:predicted phosphodiesterase
MIVISDLHLDDGTGKFSRNRDKFLKFLRHIGDEELVIAGDFFDLWRWSFKSIVRANQDIIYALHQKHPNVTLLLGNHDLNYKLMRFVISDICMSMTAYGYTILHGHQIDWRLDTPEERRLAHVAAHIVQHLDFGWLNHFVEYATASKRSNEPLMERAMGQYPHGTKFICGHSHVPGNYGWFINCGTWTGDDLRYVVLDSAGARLEVWK